MQIISEQQIILELSGMCCLVMCPVSAADMSNVFKLECCGLLSSTLCQLKVCVSGARRSCSKGTGPVQGRAKQAAQNCCYKSIDESALISLQGLTPLHGVPNHTVYYIVLLYYNVSTSTMYISSYQYRHRCCGRVCLDGDTVYTYARLLPLPARGV